MLDFLVMALFVIYIRLTNIDMTDTRLYITYWKQITGFMVVAIVSGIAMKSSESKQ
jgi:hypothetical protein